MSLAVTATSYIQGNDGNAYANCEPCAPVCCYESCGEFFVEAEFLYLRAFQGGLSNVCDHTKITDTTENGVTISRLEGNSHDPDFNWNCGYRIGAGYGFPDSNCDVEAYWTHYHSNSDGEGHKDGDGRKNHQNWKIDFNVVDALVSCECDDFSCFTLIPFGGLRYADIHQRLRSHFVSSIDRSSTISKGNSKQQFYGLGPLFGVEGDVEIGCGFDVFGYVSGAVLFGTFHVNSNHTDKFKSGTNINHLREHIKACQAVVDAGLGVGWTTCFCNYLVWLEAGLEHHHYFNENQFCGYGDLSLDGMFLGGGIAF